MLEPQTRRHLLEALQPPPGYALDQAIGTSYSLDLLALLTAPLAFTFFDWDAATGPDGIDPLALLETMRRYAGRITLFCQTGRIAVPRAHRLLFSYLEESVIEVASARENRSFHPKVWLLRYVKSDSAVRYRLLCLSRNLTFDRSWDTALVLEGELADRKYGFSANNPLGDFFAQLPSLALRPVREATRGKVDLLQREVRRVRFAWPDGFDTATFWPLGIRGHSRWPFAGRMDRVMVVAPFISEGCLKRLGASGRGNVLISRLESLEGVDRSSVADFAKVYSFDAAAAPSQSETDEADTDDLVGLHAKLYVADAGSRASIWTGSANATNAAFNGNVEFLVQLSGEKRLCGIDATLARQNGQVSLPDFLQEFDVEAPLAEVDETEQQLGTILDGARRSLAAALFFARAERLSTTDEFRMVLALPVPERAQVPDCAEVHCWPVTLHEQSAVKLATGTRDPVVFTPVSFEALTSFFAFEVTATVGARRASCRFVLNVPLEGAPSDRTDRILQAMLRDKEGLLRFLLLLLSEDEPESPEDLLGRRGLLFGASHRPEGYPGYPLFEPLVKSLARDPEKLDRVARIIADLSKTAEGRDLLPKGLCEIWDPIWKARQELRR